jgi:hypothetical protein
MFNDVTSCRDTEIAKNIQINQQTRCNHFPIYYPDVYLQLNVFRAFSRQHQELNSSLWFYRWNVVVAVLLVVFGPVNRPDHDQQHCYHHAPTVKPKAATAVVVAPDDGREDARNMLSSI